jgi:hypothetical protein
LAFEEYPDVVLSSILYRGHALDLNELYKPIVLEVSAHEAMQTADGNSMIVKPIEVSNLEDPIFFKIPLDSDMPMTCSYMDEVTQQWKALNCP